MLELLATRVRDGARHPYCTVTMTFPKESLSF